MAQYTPILALQHNNLQDQVQKILVNGVPFGGSVQRTYGCGQAVQSARVAAGDTIEDFHWKRIRTDIQRLYKHQLGNGQSFLESDYDQGKLIRWSHVVQLQNSANSIDNGCQNGTTVYSGGRYIYLSAQNAALQQAAGGWSGVRDAFWYLNFNSDDHLRSFMNAGGYIQITAVAIGGSPSLSPVNLDGVWQQTVGSLAVVHLRKSNWRSLLGGATGASVANQVTIVSSSTNPANAPSAVGTIYQNANHSVSYSVSGYYTFPGQIGIGVALQNLHYSTSSGQPAPPIGMTTNVQVTAFYPNKPADSDSLSLYVAPPNIVLNNGF